MNPYRPGAGTQPPLLTGRDDLISTFEVTLRRTLALQPSKSLMPIGLRGVGKTVLLNRFAADAVKLGYEVCSLEAPEGGNLPLLLVAKLRRALYSLDATANLRKKITRTIAQALGVLKSFALSTPDGSKISLDLDPARGFADSGNLTEDLTDVLISVGEAARDVESGLMIAIDEIQYLEDSEFASLITAIHRTTQKDLPVVLVGTGLPSVPGRVGEAKSYSERLFAFPSIGSLPVDSAKAAVSEPAAARGVRFEDGALDEIIKVTQCYPYFLQEWASHVWNHAPKTTITRSDVSAVREVVQSALDSNFFLVRLDRLTPAEKDYMRVMAELGAGPHRSADIAARYGAKMESVSPLRSQLIRKGMIYSPAYGDTAFTVPLFDDFLRRVMPAPLAKRQAKKKS